jgi:hypothetical protein
MAVSLHISILLFIRTSYARGHISSFLNQDLGTFQKSDPKDQNRQLQKFKKEGHQTKPGAARAFKLFPFF